MKRILVLTYYWPPAAGPGVQRILKFCKFLSEFGWEPHVITVEDGSYPATDNSLLNDIPEGLTVSKTKSVEPHRLYNAIRGQKGKAVPVALMGMRDSKSPIKKLSLWIRANMFIPDARKGWVRFAHKEAMKCIHENQYDAVLTTGPPHSTHLVGLRLKKELGIKWVADMRDPWTKVYTYKYMPMTEASKRKDLKLEKEVLKNADLVTVVSNGLREQFSKYNDHIEVVHNGFDEADLTRNQTVPSGDHFTLGYIGNFKPNQDVPVLWEVVKELVQEDASFKASFRLEVTGNIDPFILDEIKSLGWGEAVKLNGYLPHDEAVNKLYSSSCLLFVIPDDENNQLILTGKLFEYLASGKPMLSIGPVNGDAAGIISEAGRGKMIDYKNKEGLKSYLKELFARWKEDPGKLDSDNLQDVMQFSRRNQTRKLVNALDRLK